ncbi:hypothetical protein D3C75_755890 [compost metagenome]
MAASFSPLKAMVVEINQMLAALPNQGWIIYSKVIKAYSSPEESTTVTTVKRMPLNRSLPGERVWESSVPEG